MVVNITLNLVGTFGCILNTRFLRKTHAKTLDNSHTLSGFFQFPKTQEFPHRWVLATGEMEMIPNEVSAES